MRFSDILGHKNEIQKLVAMADNNRVPHALLLHGPSGIGKMRVARALTQYLFCQNRRGGDSCGVCPNCLQTAKLNNPDVHYVYPVIKRKAQKKFISSDYAEEWQDFIAKFPYMPILEWQKAIDAGNSQPMIYVDESEEIVRIGSLSPYGDGRKVFLVWLPEKMNLDAANKLLKQIEEPEADTLFILVSNDPGNIITTIRSRLQSVEFTAIPESEIVSYVLKQGKSHEEALEIARFARGNMNKAQVLLGNNAEQLEFAEAFIGIMRSAYTRAMVDLKNYEEKFAGWGREKAMRFADYMAGMIRESFISNLHCDCLLNMTPAERKFVDKFGPFVNEKNVVEISANIDRVREDISRYANQKIVWFDFLIELTRLIRTSLPK